MLVERSLFFVDVYFCVIFIVVVLVGAPYPKDMLLADDHPLVMSELERRQKAQGNKKTGSVAWKDQHSTLAEQYGVQWPLSVPESLNAAPWFRVLPEREREAIAQRLPEATSTVKYVFYTDTDFLM